MSTVIETTAIAYGAYGATKTAVDASNPLPVTATTTAANTLLGAVTETAPATDTASSGLNGRLQRIAQRQTTAMTGVAYTDRSIANLSGSSETLMAANTARRVLGLYNIGATAVGINLTGGTASLTVGGSVVIQAGGSIILDQNAPVGAVTIIGTLNADVTAWEG